MKKRTAIAWLVAWSVAVMMTACGGETGEDDNSTVATNHAPKATAQSVTTDEDVAKAITLVGTDEDKDTITYSVTAIPAHGTLSGTAPSVTYTPTANYHGPDSFKFKVNDGTVDSAEVAVSITVTSVNDAPVAIAQSTTTDENIAKAITLSGTDAEGSILVYSITDHPVHGTISGTLPNLIYTPNDNYNGVDSFKFTVNDGAIDSAKATLSITVEERPFRIKIKTNNSGASSDTQFLIQLTGYGDGYRVDCDSNGSDDESGLMSDYHCNYADEGEYVISIRGNFSGLNFEMGDPKKLLSIEEWGTQKWTTFHNAFMFCDNVVLSASDVPNLTAAESLAAMFSYTNVFTGDLSDWNTSNITNMVAMFQGAHSFNGNISSWDTSKVTNMHAMFSDAWSFDGDISDWNTSCVEDMGAMFLRASQFDHNISAWDVSNVKSMRYMFYGATAFNQDIGRWNTFKLKNTKYMFDHATSFNQNIGDWSMADVDYMDYMFNGASSFNQDLSEWNVESASTMNHMFHDATSLHLRDLSDWNVANVDEHADFFTGTDGTNTEPPWP